MMMMIVSEYFVHIEDEDTTIGEDAQHGFHLFFLGFEFRVSKKNSGRFFGVPILATSPFFFFFLINNEEPSLNR